MAELIDKHKKPKVSSIFLRTAEKIQHNNNGVSKELLDNHDLIPDGLPERSKAEDGIDEKLPVVKSKIGEFEFEETKEPKGGISEKVQEILARHKKTAVNITKDINNRAPIEIPSFITPSDATRVSMGDMDGTAKITKEDGTIEEIPTRLKGKSIGETTGDLVTTFGNSFNRWLNEVIQNTTNPNKQGIPLGLLMDIPGSSRVTKFIPGYENIRYSATKNLPDLIKNFKLKDDYQFGDTPPQEPVEFIGHLGAGLVPLVLSSMAGLPPMVSFPLIQEPGLQQMLKKGEISEGDANWERSAATLMGGMFELPLANKLLGDLSKIEMKESMKLGLTKAGDVIFKTLGTGFIDATKQLLQDKKPDFSEIVTNAGTIFVMELFGGHKKLRKMSEKYGDGKLAEFVKKLSRNEETDPEIREEVEAIHNKPITDVRRLLIGPREHRFEVDETGAVRDIQAEKPQEMLLSSLEKIYGMTKPEIELSRENIRTKPLAVNEEAVPITDPNRLLYPSRENVRMVTSEGEVKPYEFATPKELLLSSRDVERGGMKPHEIEASKLKIGEKNLTAIEKPLSKEAPKIDMTEGRVEEVATSLRSSQLKVGDKIKSEHYKNPDEVLEVVDVRKDNMVKVRDSQGFEGLVSKEGLKEANVKAQMSNVKEEISPQRTLSEKAEEKTKERIIKTSKGTEIKVPENIKQEDFGLFQKVLSTIEREHQTPAYWKNESNKLREPRDEHGRKLNSPNKQSLKEADVIDEALKMVSREGQIVDPRFREGEEKKEKLFVAENKDPELRKVGDVQSKAEGLAAEFLKSRGRNRQEITAKTKKAIEDYVKAWEEYTGEKFRGDKESKITRVQEYITAKENIKSRKGKFGLQSSVIPGGGFNPENLPDLMKVGKFHFENIRESAKDKAVSFGTWAIKMVEDFGDYVKPKLREIWREVNAKGEKTFTTETTEGTEKASEKSKVDPRFREGEKLQRVNQQGDYESWFESEKPGGKEKEGRIQELLKENPDMERKEGFKLVEMKDKYYELKNERDNKWESTSPEYRKLTLRMNELKSQIEVTLNVVTKGRELVKEAEPKTKEDIYKRIIKKLPEFESRVNEKGYYGEDAIEQVRKEIRKDLLTKDAWQMLKPGEKSGLIKLLDEKFKVLNKERLQIGGSIDEPYAETRLRKRMKRGILQSLTQVEKWGEAGKELAQRMRKYHDRERELMGEPSVTVLEAGKLTGEEYKNLTSIRKSMMMELSNRAKPINANVERINNLLNKYYEETAILLRKRGFETYNPVTGEVREFHPRTDYDPRMLEITLDKLGIARDKNGEPIFNQAREKQLNYMVEGKQAGTKAEASDMLDRYITQEKVNIGKMGNVEFSRIKDIEFAPEMYIQDPMRRFVNYATKVSRRIAHEENFGMDGGTALRLLDRIKSEHFDEGFARDVYRYETGNLTPKERDAMSDVNLIKGFQAVTKFSPFTTLRNSLQGFLGSSIRGNLEAAIRGFIKSFSPTARKNAYLSGALADNIESVVIKEFGGDSNFVSNYLKWIGFTGTDRFNRVVGALSGEVFYKDMLNKVKSQTSKGKSELNLLSRGLKGVGFTGDWATMKKRALREFEKLGLNAKEVTERGKFTEAELNKIRRTFAGDTQFNIRPSDLPLWWSSPMGKILTQWKPFSYKMTQMIRDNVIKEIKNGNPMPLITMVAAYGIGGEAVNVIIDSVRGFLNFNPRKEEKEKGIFTRSAYMRIKEGDVEGLVYRLLDDYAGLGALSFLVDMFRSMGYGKSGSTLSGVTGALLGPTASTFLSATADVTGPILSKLFSSEGEWDDALLRSARGLYRNVLTNVPFGSIPRTFGFTKFLEKQIFPEKTSEKQKMYEKLEEQGVDIKKLEEIDKRRKEVGKLYDKAKETKNKADIDAYVKADDELDKIETASAEYQKFLELKREKNDETSELFGSGKFKIYNELKAKGVDINKLKAIDNAERDVTKLKEKAEQTKRAYDVQAFKRADYELDKKKKASREWVEYEKLKKKYSDEKKKEREKIGL